MRLVRLTRTGGNGSCVFLWSEAGETHAAAFKSHWCKCMWRSEAGGIACTRLRLGGPAWPSTPVPAWLAGAAFMADMLSKHALHAGGAEEVLYAGECMLEWIGTSGAVSGRGRRAVGGTAAKGTEVWLEMRA